MEETVAHIISPSESHMFLMDCAPLLQQMAHTHYTAFIDAGSYGCSCFARVCVQGSGALHYPNGVPTSLRESGQQWDYPNAWPPLQHMLIDGKEAMN